VRRELQTVLAGTVCWYYCMQLFATTDCVSATDMKLRDDDLQGADTWVESSALTCGDWLHTLAGCRALAKSAMQAGGWARGQTIAR